jgi:8-hydroxy-5-deazaflavin:NADPH oxidoreductase
MKIGIIGAGNIGELLDKKLAAAGHEVRLANSRGPESLQEVVRDTGIRAVTKEDAVRDVDVIILSVPFARMSELSGLLTDVPHSVTVIDTSNYYPARDGQIAEVDAGKPETVWASEQVGRPLIKAWNALLAQTLATSGAEKGVPGRIAIPVAGDDPASRTVAMELVDASGFDTVDAGTLAESWRIQPGTPAYCTELTDDELTAALASADKERAPKNRDAIMQRVMAGAVPFTQADMVANNRAMSV